MNLRSLLSIFFAWALLCSQVCSPAQVLAAPDKSGVSDDIKETLSKGDLFLGGKPPVLESMTVTKEVKGSDGNIFYLYKALVNRASGDTNGRLLLYKAKNWRQAYFDFLGISPGFKTFLDIVLGSAPDTAPFPTLYLKYDYFLSVSEVDGDFIKKSAGSSRRPKGPNRFIEQISFGIPPGTYEVSLGSEVDLDDHPLKTVISAVSLLKDFVEILEWATLVGIAKNVAKSVISTGAVVTTAKYRLEVLAKVPDLQGLTEADAEQALNIRKLNGESKKSSACIKKQDLKVIGQKIKPGKRLAKGKTIPFTVCSYKPNRLCEGLVGFWQVASKLEGQIGGETSYLLYLNEDFTYLEDHSTVQFRGEWRCKQGKSAVFLEIGAPGSGNLYKLSADGNSFNGRNILGAILHGERI